MKENTRLTEILKIEQCFSWQERGKGGKKSRLWCRLILWSDPLPASCFPEALQCLMFTPCFPSPATRTHNPLSV